ncbi:MAG TPA: hypothetical protein VMV94_12270 [Phycisphaerae bacterium]|nr:hypothetical protein [Phycisphaerae bacterium]
MRLVGGVVLWFVAAIALLVCAGCTSSPAMSDARKAEKEGSAPVAYEDYCKAARKNPGDAGAVAGLKRTGPPAAAQWQAQAWQAMEQRRYGEAWRMLMRALEIRPDDPTVVKLIRQLEQQHPTEVAEARGDWLRRGSGALAMAGLEEGMAKEEHAPASSQPIAVAKTEPKKMELDQAPAQASPSPAPASAAPAPANPNQPNQSPSEAKKEGPAPSDSLSGSGPGVRPKPADREIPRGAGDTGMSESQKRHREWAEAFAKADGEQQKETPKRSEEKTKPVEAKQQPEPPPPKPIEIKRPAEPPPPKPIETRRSTEPPPKPAETKRPPEPPPGKPVERKRSIDQPPLWPPTAQKEPPAPREQKGDPSSGQIQPRAAEVPQGFLLLRTLSKKDKGFPKEAMLVDGILIKLKGTGDEPKTDIELYDGKKRIKKIKGLRIGSSETFPGHSGVEYRLVVLSIHHKTDTIRVGVQELPRIVTPVPAPPAKN